MASGAAEIGHSIHSSFLLWRKARYGKIAAVLSLLAIILYVVDDPGEPPNGGTWLGYSYGVAGLALIAWLAWFGIRRRRYGGSGAPLQGWLSAHVYLGLALVVIASLHTGFRFHWNIHTLAFVLMLLVIASGIFGIYAFWRYPTKMTRNRAGATLSSMIEQLAAADSQCRDLTLNMSDDVVALVAVATEDQGGRFTWREIVTGRRPDPLAGPTGAAIDSLRESVGGSAGLTPADVLPLVQALTNRLVLIEKISRDRRYQALLLLWRAVHVPLTFALIVALSAHVLAVFFYW